MIIVDEKGVSSVGEALFSLGEGRNPLVLRAEEMVPVASGMPRTVLDRGRYIFARWTIMEGP